jgi:adenylate kinase family enzyme
MRYIILVSGWAGSGKDTFADRLVEKFNFKKLAFATSLKKAVAQKYNIDIELTKTQEGKQQIIAQCNKTVRELLIEEALVMRKVDAEVFIKKTCEEINEFDINQNVVISDLRFKDEYNYVFKKYHNKYNTKVNIFRIERFDKQPLMLASESELNNVSFDKTILNKGSIDEFEKKIDEVEIVYYELSKILNYQKY